MSERIQKLCLLAADGIVDPNGPFTAEEFIAFQEKFAELIVRECVTHIEKDRLQKEDLRETEYDDGYLDGMGRAERILKEHFGVK